MNTNDAIPADELLSHRKWLNVLARRLVADESQADDIEQETLAIALERPPQTLGSMRAWLGRVARRTARGTARSAIRRARRECLAARSERVPSAAEVVERVARQRRIVDAVLELEPPMRHVVLLRFYEGMAPREIASQLGLSANAVRTRLSRALAILRARLQAELGPDYRKLVLPLPVGWLGGGLFRGAAVAIAIAAAIGVAWVTAIGIDPASSPLPQRMSLMTQRVEPEPARIRRFAPPALAASAAAKPGRDLGDHMAIRVVDGASDRVVRAARVRYLPLEPSAKTFKIYRRYWHVYPLLHEIEWIDKFPGESLGATDRDGRVELRRPTGPVQVWARRGWDWGTCIVAPGESVATIRLWLVRRLRVYVSTAGGPRVKNMPVVLEIPSAIPLPRWVPEMEKFILEPRRLWWGRTDSNGLARIPFIAPSTVAPAKVSLGIPARACAAVDVKLGERIQRVDLVAPDTGRLDLQLLDPKGRRLDQDAIVSIAPVEEDMPIATRYYAEHGSLKNLHVSCGEAFTVTAISLQSDWVPISSTIPGPTGSGGRRVLKLRFRSVE